MSVPCPYRFFYGPVETDPLNATAGWSSDSTERVRRLSLSAMVAEPAGTQLSELFANPPRRISHGPDTGILEPFWTDFPLWREFNGLYLWTTADVSGPMVYGRVPGRVRDLSLEGVLVQPGRLVISRSSRLLPSDYVTGTALVANPVHDTAIAGSDFVVDPGGTLHTRTYDPAAWGAEVAEASRAMVIRTGAPSALASTVLPAVDAEDDGIPGWVEFRGGDVRGYDAREDFEVYGPAHPFAQTEDAGATNGLIRFTCGPRTLLPYLAVEVRTAAGEWLSAGYLHLGGPGLPTRVALLSRTPEEAVVSLTVRGMGEITVTLRRGERMLRIAHGDTDWPSTTDRLVSWRSAPPAPLTDGWGLEAWGQTPWGGDLGDVEGGLLGGSPLAGGRTYEVTVDGGAVRVTSAAGFTRALAILSPVPSAPTHRQGLGVLRRTRSWVVGAFVASATAGDDLADHHAQLAAENEQTMRVS